MWISRQTAIYENLRIQGFFIWLHTIKSWKVGSGESQGSQVSTFTMGKIFLNPTASVLQQWWVAPEVKKAQHLSLQLCGEIGILWGVLQHEAPPATEVFCAPSAAHSTVCSHNSKGTQIAQSCTWKIKPQRAWMNWHHGSCWEQEELCGWWQR